MGPWDARLSVLAAEARVRTSHVHHLLAALAEPNFTVAAFALFTGLEARHVERIMAALQTSGLLPEKKRRQTRVRGERLPPSFVVPTTWRLWAQTERGWAPDIAETVAAEFVDYWHSAPNGAKLDWEATWRNWVRGSKRPSGAYVGRETEPWTDERKEALRLSTIATYRNQGRHTEADELERSTGAKVGVHVGRDRDSA